LSVPRVGFEAVQLAHPVAADASAGAWIPASLAAAGVGALVPPVFAAYARVLHPAVRYAGDDDVAVPWAEVAAANATVVHPLVQWPGLTGSWDFVADDNQSPLWDDAPAEGHLPAESAARLAAVLAGHTSTPRECWFGVAADLAAGPPGTAALELPGGRFLLVRGPVGLASENLVAEPNEQSAHLWWPADRAWCVVTDPALMSTYVGGTAACIAEVLTTAGLEALPVTVDDPTAPGSDPVNPVLL
jgi:hypothetical protein